MIRQRTAFRLALVGVAAPAALLLGAGPALAAGEVAVSNTETIQAHLDATGKVKDKRVYEQLAFTGKGKVSVSNPVSTDGLRNLDGFGGFSVKDGNMVATVDVDGSRRMRSVSNFTKTIPLTVEVSYTLNGKPVKPQDVVGRSGDLEVHYKVTNTSGKPGSVSFDDGTGTQMTKDADVVIPMVGSLSLVLPSTFTDVTSKEANLAGDGNGGTKLSFTMTLFPPIGSDTAEFGYSAKIRDGVVPPASITALPLNPLESPSFAGGAESYKSGAETGAQLTDGAIQIDSNLLKLRDGANQLLAGLIKLQDGAHQLNDGLANDAAPGAAKLADGANQLKAGTGDLAKGAGDAKAGSKQVADGADQLAGGTGQVADGAGAAKAGSSQLADGAAELDFQLGAFQDGLTDLANGISAIPQNDDYKRLLAGIGSIQDAIGDPADPTTLRGGLALLKSGVTTKLQPGVQALITGVGTLKSKIDASIASDVPTLKALATSAQTNVQGLAAGKGCIDGSGPHPAADPDCPALLQALTAAGTLVVAMDTPVGTPGLEDGGLLQKLQAASVALDTHEPGTHGASDPGGVLYGLGSLKVGIDDHAPGANGPSDPGGLEYGLNQLIVGTDDHEPGTYGSTDAGGLAYGLQAVNLGVQQLVDTIVTQLLDSLGTPTSDPETTARGAAAALNAGAGQIADGADQLDSGLGDLQAGVRQLHTGANKLSKGAGDLDSGLGQIQAGAGQLDDGAGQVADGANQLSSGLNDAASGSGQLADGLDEAAGKAPALGEGAQQLSDEGTQVLIGKGKDTAQTFGERYALIEAGAQRAQTESMAYGAPEGATGETAYSLEIAGADGESGRNWGRGLGALAIFAIGAGAAAAIRQRLV